LRLRKVTDLSDIEPLALAYIAVEWTIRIAMLVVVPFRRSPAAARGWLLIVFFLPVPALALYLTIGRPTYPRWRRRRFTQARELLTKATQEIAHSVHCSRPTVPGNLAPAALLIQHLGQFPLLGGNRIRLLADYDEVIERLVIDIDRATHHVHLLTYIFADDAVGRRVIAGLLRAAGRGVTCRVIIDAVGSRRWATRVIDSLEAGGVSVARALPVSLFRRHSARADLRNHRKIVVIDGFIGYIGSQNIVAADFAPGVVNQELVAWVGGPVILELQAVFATDWFLETGQALDDPALFQHEHTESGIVAQVLPSGPDYPIAGAGRLVVALVHGAQKRVVLTTPYFIPDEALLQALQTAVLRGVEVHLILSRVADNWLVSLAQRSYYEELLTAGVSIHLFREGLLHAKHHTIDNDIAVIGSTNIDIRSFLLNAEVSLILYDTDATAVLQAEQKRNLATSDQLTAAEWARRSPAMRFVENVARLVSPLL
jgi:cardiolipin synthase